MIRPAGKYDGFLAVFPCKFQSVLALFLHVILEVLVFGSRFSDSFVHFLRGNACPLEHFVQCSRQFPVIIVRQERMCESHLVLLEHVIHVACDNFRVSGYYRAVVMVRSRLVLYPLIVDAGIEYPFHAVLHQPFYVSMDQLGRIACRIR